MADPVYHVTFSKSLPYIQKRGLDPLSGSLWQQAGTRERYQDQPSVFSFQDPEEALRWASKMKWEFSDDVSGSSDISIVKLRGGDKWEPDPAAGGPDIGKTSMRSLGLVPSSDILEVMSLPTPATVNKEFQRQVPGGRIDEWLKFYGDRLRSLGADEPRPPDQPNLPALLGPPEEPGKKPSSKGGIFRGIGSLMRRRIFPLVQAAQAGWGMLSPEAKAEVEAFLKRPAHELVGMDKPGIEYFKEWLGISPEDLGETILSPGPSQEADEFPTESSVDAAYERYMRNLEKSRSDLSNDEVMTDVLDSFLVSKSAGHFTQGEGGSVSEPQSLTLPPTEERLKVHSDRMADDWVLHKPGDEGTLTTGSLSWYEDRNLLAPPMTYEEFLKRRYGLDVPELLSGESWKQEPRPKAAGGFIDKPLYDNLIAPSRGSFIDKPLYEGAF